MSFYIGKLKVAVYKYPAIFSLGITLGYRGAAYFDITLGWFHITLWYRGGK